MTLAIFDLDNTLLNGDSDHGWGEFIIHKGLVDAEQYRKKNDGFYQAYLEGQLDIYEYQNFCLEVIASFDAEHLKSLLIEFVSDFIEPMITAKALALIEKHRRAGHTLLIITATNEIITQPIANRLEIPHLIATQAERLNGKLSGKVEGVASYAAGKIERLNLWLTEHPNESISGAHFYSDSHNDIPLLEHIDHPYVVDGDEKLINYAKAKNWPCLSLR